MSPLCRNMETGIHRRILEIDSGPWSIASTKLKSRCFPMRLYIRQLLESGGRMVEKRAAAVTLVVVLVAVEPTDEMIFRCAQAVS